MIAVIRARFVGETKAHWSDSAMRSWLDPNIYYSLAHFMTKTSFQQFDMRYHLFPPIELQDPRGDTSYGYGGSPKEQLVDGVLRKLTHLYDPDWDQFDRFLVCFAGRVEAMFGGGFYRLPSPFPFSDPTHTHFRSVITGAVIDQDAPFDGICEEVGHSFFLSHELDRNAGEYGCPYSAMSSMIYGGLNPTFVRPINSLLPVGGMPGQGIPCYGLSKDVQREIGPYFSAVHLYLTAPGFAHPDSVSTLPPVYVQTPQSFRLHALDVGVDCWPQRKRVLAVLPPVNGGDMYFLELRRPVGYDNGLKAEAASPVEVPAAVVIYSYNSQSQRITYEDCIPLSQPSGDRDYHSSKAGFAVRINSFDLNVGWVNLTVGGGDFWKYFSVHLESNEDKTVVRPTNWETVHIKPCSLYPASDYKVRYHFQKTHMVLQALSYGYDKPQHKWFLEDNELDPTHTFILIRTPARKVVNGAAQPQKLESVRFDFIIKQGRLDLSSAAEFKGIEVKLRVVVSETSPAGAPGVSQERSAWTNLSFDNVELEWDDRYIRDMERCWKEWLAVVNMKRKVGLSDLPKKVDPRPKFDDLTVNELVRHLSATNPSGAKAVVNGIAELAGVSKIKVIQRYLSDGN